MNACLGQFNVTKGTLQLPSNFISEIKIKNKYRIDLKLKKVPITMNKHERFYISTLRRKIIQVTIFEHAKYK